MNALPLGDIPLDTFLSDYWQKKPLLIRGAIPNINSPIDADTLAGLACEEGSEARLVTYEKQTDDWHLAHGPFEHDTFAQLPKTDWTLLVQAVDHWFPQATEFLQQFSFIPQWRIDDLMMSYASDGGGVGPHFDNYDVFLVQTDGRRRWEVGGICDAQTELKEDVPLSLLAEFEPQHSWILDPGDLLYLPPGYSHCGTAVGDGCITCSVGFRAPSHAEMLQDYTDFLAENLNEAIRYTDEDLTPQDNPGQISPAALEKIQQIILHHTNSEDSIRSWFGQYITRPKYAHESQSPNSDEIAQIIIQLKEHLASGGAICRNESSRFAFTSDSGRHCLYVDGHEHAKHRVGNDLIEQLCRELSFDKNTLLLSDDNNELLAELLLHEALYLVQAETD